MKTREYNRNEVAAYAEKWAYRRNPQYYNFESIRFLHITDIGIW